MDGELEVQVRGRDMEDDDDDDEGRRACVNVVVVVVAGGVVREVDAVAASYEGGGRSVGGWC